MKKFLIYFGILILLSLGIFWGLKNQNFPPFTKQDVVIIDEQKVKNPEDLYGQWEWISFTDALGKIISPDDSSKFVLTLSSEGKLDSTTDCNSISGSFIKNEEAVSIGSLVSTEMACSGNTLEAAYSFELSQVSTYSISGNILTLNLIKDFGTMKFTKK